MKKFLVLGFVLASFGVADRAYAQEGPAGAGRAEITLIPVGGVFFTENTDDIVAELRQLPVRRRRHLQHQSLHRC